MKWFEASIGLRYARGRSSQDKKSNFIGLISRIAMTGIAVGVMVLITVLSVVNGFESELEKRILSLAPHANINGTEKTLNDYQHVIDTAMTVDNVVKATPYIEDYGMLTYAAGLSAVQIRGVDPADDLADLSAQQQIRSGNLDTFKNRSYQIVIGSQLAKELNAVVGDKIVLLISQASITPAGLMPRMRRFTVAAIFEVGMHEFDKNVAFIHIKDAARLYRMKDAVTGVRLYLNDPFTAGDSVLEVAEKSGGLYYVQDWTRNNNNLFRQVAATKQILLIVLLLVIAIAAFNIVSTLMLVIDDKQGDIAILRTMGGRAQQIMRIFMTQGAVIGIIGTIWGVGLGILLALNIERLIGLVESSFNIDILADDVYLITDLPSAINWPDILLIATIAIGLSLLATLYPAWKASRTEPAQVLRHE